MRLVGTTYPGTLLYVSWRGVERSGGKTVRSQCHLELSDRATALSLSGGSRGARIQGYQMEEKKGKEEIPSTLIESKLD